MVVFVHDLDLDSTAGIQSQSHVNDSEAHVLNDLAPLRGTDHTSGEGLWEAS